MKKLLLAVTVLLVSVSASAAFSNDMTQADAKAEVLAAERRGDSLDVMARAAFAAGVDATVITLALISAGKDAGDVTTALVRARYNSGLVIEAAVSTGANRLLMFVAAQAGTNTFRASAPNLQFGPNASSTFNNGAGAGASPT